MARPNRLDPAPGAGAATLTEDQRVERDLDREAGGPDPDPLEAPLVIGVEPPAPHSEHANPSAQVQPRRNLRPDEDSAAGIDEPRQDRFTPIDMGEGDPSGAMAPDIHPTTKKLSALGSLIDYRVQRLSPRDLPSSEMGWSTWIPLIQSNPTNEDIEEEIYRKYGGGEYELMVRSHDTMRPQRDSLRISLQGMWNAITPEGEVVRRSRYGVASPAAGGAASPAGPSSTPGVTDAFSLADAAMRQVQAERMQLETLRQQGRQSENTSLGAILPALLQREQKPPTDWAAVITAGFGAVTALLGTILPVMKSSSDAKEAAQQRRHDELLALMRDRESPKTPQEQVAVMMALLDVFKEGAKNRMGVEATLLKESMTTLFKSANVPEGSPVWSFVKDMVGDAGPDIVKAVAAWATARAQKPQAAQPAAARPAPASPRGIPPPPPAEPPQPRKPGETIWDAAAPAPAAPPPPPPEAAPASAAPDINELDREGRLLGEEAIAQVLSTIGMFIQARPEPVVLWDYVHEKSGRDTVAAFVACPESFRAKMQEQQEKKMPASVAFWVQGVPNTEIQVFAKQLDQAVLQLPGALEWLNRVIDFCPWVETPDAPAAPPSE